jgi:integrase
MTPAIPQPGASLAAAGARPISSCSLWGDAIWQFDLVRPGATGCDRTIDWGFDLSDGSQFTDPTWDQLREATKCFLWSLQTDPPAGRRRLRDSSLVSIFNQMKVLIRWMAAEGYPRFADLDADAAERFLAAVLKRPGRRGGTLATAAVQQYIKTLGRLHAQRQKLGDGVADDLGAYLAESAVPNRRVARPERALPYTPDPIAIALVAGAIRLIGQPADDIIALRDLARSAYAYRVHHLPSFRHERRARRTLSAFVFTTLDGEAAPWHRSPLCLRDVNYLVERIYDACFVVIAYLVGMRASEILGIELGCIEHHRSGDATESIAYLRGRIYKTAQVLEGKPHLWVAPEPVVRAIAVLESLSEPARQKLDRPQLWLMTRDPVLLTLPIEIPRSSTFVNRLNGAFGTFVDLPLHGGRRWHLTTHQGRKTFARFVGKRDRTGLHALQMHFGHVNRAMTDSAYVGTDFELAELIGAEAIGETRAALEELLTATNLAGAAGRMLASRSRFRGRTRDGEVREYVDFILKDSGMVLGVCDWGYCVYRREHSACQGDESGPNPVLRTQSTCVRCANFAVTERHRPIWEERRQRNLRLLDNAALDPESRRLAEQRIAESDQILTELDTRVEHGA